MKRRKFLAVTIGLGVGGGATYLVSGYRNHISKNGSAKWYEFSKQSSTDVLLRITLANEVLIFRLSGRVRDLTSYLRDIVFTKSFPNLTQMNRQQLWDANKLQITDAQSKAIHSFTVSEIESAILNKVFNKAL